MMMQSLRTPKYLVFQIKMSCEHNIHFGLELVAFWV